MLEDLSKISGLLCVENLLQYPFIQKKVQLFPYTFVKQHGLIPLKEENNTLYVAVSDPYNLDATEQMHSLVHTRLQEVIASRAEIEQAIEICYGATEKKEIIEEIPSSEKENKHTEYDLLEQNTDSANVNILNNILIEALRQKASDIHFEPIENGFLVRYRIDGILHQRHAFSKEVQIPIVSRIKVLAQLDIAEQRRPQDGRMKLRLGEREIDFRISTIPVVFGERVVLRILDRGQVVSGLNHLGMRDEIQQKMQRDLKSPQGIILVTGPTGSGKTTTLYSALTEISSMNLNIMTIEDPVEFKLEKMAQIAVNPKTGISFARGLRHILRQDPDVIMVGEIRDKETAEIAIQSSLTGHLVLTTLHTNDAPSAIVRLLDMKIEPYLIASSLLAVQAQRLVRKICPQCKEPYEISDKDKELFQFCKNQTSVKVAYRGKGCKSCFGLGYKGRAGIYEYMPVNSLLKKHIVENVNNTEIQKIARSQGMLSLREEGLKLCLQGITSLEEVFRVTQQIED